MNQKVGILGGGSWATAIIKMLCNNESEVHWWMRSKDQIDYIKTYKHNPNYLSSVELALDKLVITDDLTKVLNECDILILAIPAAFLKDALSRIPSDIFPKKVWVSAIKGIVPDENLIVGDYLREVLNVPYEQIVVISGPCHAEEVAMEKLSYLTIAGQNAEISKIFANKLNCRYIKTTVSDDIFGTEYAAVLKNIIAVASGICHGLGYGDNFQAVLVSNAIQEIKQFVDVVHPIDRDIKASAYLGDLLVTAYSQFSRNRSFGNMIGKGYTIRSAQIEMNMVAEGYYASNCIEVIRKRHNVSMPISEAVYQILYENHPPALEMKNLSDILS